MDEKLLIGWEEWCSLPLLNLPALKVKIDTGARTSALHAFNIEPFFQNGEKHVHFQVHPIQGNDTFFISCSAKVNDQRNVINSGGYKEYRYVITTPVQLGHITREIELTLTDRGTLSFRMLLGRAAMNGLAIIDPAKSCCHGKLKKSQLLKLYPDSKNLLQNNFT